MHREIFSKKSVIIDGATLTHLQIHSIDVTLDFNKKEIELNQKVKVNFEGGAVTYCKLISSYFDDPIILKTI